jgi:hypothetical protein
VLPPDEAPLLPPDEAPLLPPDEASQRLADDAAMRFCSPDDAPLQLSPEPAGRPWSHRQDLDFFFLGLDCFLFSIQGLDCFYIFYPRFSV